MPPDLRSVSEGYTPPGKPILGVDPDLIVMMERGMRALTSIRDGAPGPVFVRAGMLVEIDDDSRIRTVSAPRLRTYLSLGASWEKSTAKGVAEVPPPMELVAALASNIRWPGLYPLISTTDHPWIRCEGPHAGQLVTSPGYDAESCTWGTWDPALGVQVARLVDDLEPHDAHAQLLDLVSDFPFIGPDHRSSALAGWLTAAARPGIAGNVPLWVVTSSTPGSGKGLLVDVAAVSIVGKQIKRAPWPALEAEAEKRIMGIALAGIPRVMLDNIDGTLGGPSLDAALTAAESGYMGRVLGESRIVELPLRVWWTATGNNVQIKGDLVRRVILTRIDPAMERPEQGRVYRHPDVLGVARKRRPHLLAAALRLVRAGVEAPSEPIGSYETWGRVIRGALLAVGEPDPWRVTAELREEDRTLEALRSVLDAWRDLYGETEITTKDLARDLGRPTLTEPQEALRDVLVEVAPDRSSGWSSRKLAIWLGRHRDRVVGGLRFVRGGRSSAGRRWSVGTP